MAIMNTSQNDVDLIDTVTNFWSTREGPAYYAINCDSFKYSNPADLDHAIMRSFRVGSLLFAMVLGFNNSAMSVGTEKKTWAEFSNIKRLLGRRTPSGMKPNRSFVSL